jgi:hypothetical protein
VKLITKLNMGLSRVKYGGWRDGPYVFLCIYPFCTVHCTVSHAVKLFAQYSAERKASVSSSSHAFTVYIFPFPPREGAHGVAA